MSGPLQKPVAVIVIPTYQEAHTIGDLVDHLFSKTFPSIERWECRAIIVDGKSPDGTADVVRARMKIYENLFLLVEKQKEGLGAAYLKGFKMGMEELCADVLFEFDGDFQHPPDMIPLMLAQIERGADFVLGSRSLKGGSIPRGWGVKRCLYGLLGRLVTRILLFFPTKNFFRITDPNTGLRASRVKGFVDRFDSEFRYSVHFGYKVETLYRMVGLNARIVEVPLKFGLRKGGESKMESQTAWDVFRTAFLLRWNDPSTKRFIKFCVVGFTGYVINASALELFRRTHFTGNIALFFTGYTQLTRFALLTSQSAWSAAFAAELAIISNFLFNNFWTFSSHTIRSPLRFFAKMFQFNLTSIGAVVIQFLVIGFATYLFGDTPLVRGVALVCAIAFLIIPYNWTIYNWLIWKVKRLKKGVKSGIDQEKDHQ
jgi:dolichol-phosphate mannosyltransferase